MNTSIGFIGMGNMASAILKGIFTSKSEHTVYAYDIDSDKVRAFEKCGVICCLSIEKLIENCSYVFFAVKPQVISEVLSAVAHCQNLQDKVYISMAAGISTTYISSSLNSLNLKIVRIMPNTPMMLGYGATAMCHTDAVQNSELSVVRDILSSCSIVCDINEAQMNAVTSVNGSGPAYLFLFAKAVCNFATEENISYDTALNLFCQTMIGSAEMLKNSGLLPEELIKMVASPGGTTLEALKVFEDKQFEQIIKSAMSACTKRAGELGK